ncbi:GNAT family N-acetyltransferase [Natronoglycomyces albus]|uniref:GNAT family N-acetyltransferase n=1 Tax=Natronoglycomyces albus TaxID=2811108 RepID=A0A895XVC8_9ACTN|nr:GNAT family N-acetyltransferase [Natronoglycomyces albus]QSB05598.1 GNAT family N-acetyltransferase [Natronoglycomyces albus]
MTDIDIIPLSINDPSLFESWIDCNLACDEQDLPGLSQTSPMMMRARAIAPSATSDVRRFVAVSGPTVVGTATVARDRENNSHKAGMAVSVHPQWRRRGIGTRLYEQAESTVREWGCTTIWAGYAAEFTDRPDFEVPGETFAAQRGFALAMKGCRRVNDLTKVDAEHLAALYASAAESSADYEIVTFEHQVPDEAVEGYCQVKSRVLLDAPMGDLDAEEETYSPTLWRDIERQQQRMGVLWLGVYARHKETGDLAGLSEIEVRVGDEVMAYQNDTIVAPAHRGHRLGLRLKIDMQRHLLRWRPQMRFIQTFNAEDNTFMNAVNDQVGFRTHSSSMNLQKKL